jgi:dTDP-4-dehydrorhamnose reductase
MLGGELTGLARERGLDVVGVDLPDIDITDVQSCRAAVQSHDTVVNCAAWTAVDAAEDAEAAAFTVNAVGPAHLARACAEAGARLVHISTDYVFPGDVPAGGARPYAEDDTVGPRSAYGRTKVAGEWAVRAHLPDSHYLVRTAWLYGRDGPSFVHTMRRLALQDDAAVTVVDDQHGQPTWTADVADRVLALLSADAPCGTYHATSSGRATWFDLARQVFSQVGADADRVQPVPTSAYPRPAPRPAWSVLGHDAWAGAGLEPIGHWQPRLATFVADRFGEEQA